MERIYNLRIEAKEPNPKWEDKAPSMGQIYNQRYDEPREPRYLNEKILEVELTSEQWEKVRAAVLKEFV